MGKKWLLGIVAIAICIILLSPCLAPIIAYKTIGQKYYYDGGKPPTPLQIALAIDFKDRLHLVWNIIGWESSFGHNMQGIWYLKMNNNGDILLNKIRISDVSAGYDPQIIVDKNNNVHIIWVCGGEWTDQGYIEKGEYVILNDDGKIMGREIIKYFNRSENILDNLPLNNDLNLFNESMVGTSINNSYGIKGEHPIFVKDSRNNTHIVSIGPEGEGYYTKLDEEGNKEIDNKEIDLIPECVSLHTRGSIIMAIVVISVSGITAITILWQFRKLKEEGLEFQDKRNKDI